MNIGVRIRKLAGGTPALPGGRTIFVAVISFLLTLSGFAADVSAAFDSANRLYEQGKFADAASAYQKIVESGSVSAAIYFNLGNAYFKSGQLGRAIAALREAENLTPRDANMRANLQFIRGRVQGPTGSAESWQRWLSVLTLNEWAILTAAILWVWLGLLILIQFRPALKQSLRGLLWCGAVVILLFGGCTYAAWSGESTKTAVIISPDVVVHNGPLDEAPTAATVHDGAELTVLDTKNDWLQVQVDAKRIGWVKKEQVVLASGA